MSSIYLSNYWPFCILLLAIVLVVLLISKFKIHPFISLVISSIFVGLLSHELPIDISNHLVAAVELPMRELGSTAGKIAWVIALAAIIGTAMMESGAARKIVDSLLLSLGEAKAGWALLISGFILSIPVFFDTVFFLLIPIAIALAVKTGKNFVYYVIAICAGAVITHSLVPPTPGPLIMAETLGIDIGTTVIAGVLCGILPSIIALNLGKRMDSKLNIPVRISNAMVDNKSSNLGLIESLMPIILPIIFIASSSFVNVLRDQPIPFIEFLGNKNIAMAIGAGIALWSWSEQKQLSATGLWKACSKPLEIAGIIILITSAGGAFGAMIKHSGIATSIEAATTHFQIHYLLLAWLISAVMKTAQGSTTVAVITASSIMYALIGDGSSLSYHPIYVLLAVGFGGGFISWMNDSGFWVVSKMSGFTEKEALQTWTYMFAVIAVVGLVQVLILSYVLPLR